MFDAHIKFEREGIDRKLRNGQDKAKMILTEQIVKDSNEYVPMLEGVLKGSALSNSDYKNGIAVWQTPYARRLYYNPQFNFSKDANPKAGGLWFERAKSNHLKEWQDIIAKEYT
ncbi:minor capsid protein [Facklamia sp. P13064]|uniref:minor capsid protein n=1 Tax=Facklamia sp. P13064 TaxID=3421953 RepID=UPI003D164FF9